MTFNRIDPNALSGPRAYFTEWAVSGSPSPNEIAAQSLRSLRRLKALLLTKKTIVFAASHLDSPIALRILMDSPVLLDRGILMPALREDRAEIEAVSTDPAVRAFVHDRNITAVTWKLDANVSWFKDRLCAELADPHSVVRGAIGRHAPSFDPTPLVADIVSTTESVQDIVERHAHLLAGAAQVALRKYRELLYHMSGARVVQCESFLPQENMVDHDLTAATQRERLSEDVILVKLFIEQALRTLNRKAIPIEVLDSLSINEVLTLRQVIEASDFAERYDELVGTAIAAATSLDPKTSILKLEQLEAARARLFADFTTTFERELKAHVRLKRKRGHVGLVSPSVSVALGAAGFVLPGIGPIVASLLSLAKDGVGLRDAIASLINTQTVFADRNDVDSAKRAEMARLKVLTSGLKRSATNSSLIDIADLYGQLAVDAFRL